MEDKEQRRKEKERFKEEGHEGSKEETSALEHPPCLSSLRNPACEAWP